MTRFCQIHLLNYGELKKNEAAAENRKESKMYYLKPANTIENFLVTFHIS